MHIQRRERDTRGKGGKMNSCHKMRGYTDMKEFPLWLFYPLRKSEREREREIFPGNISPF